MEEPPETGPVEEQVFILPMGDLPRTSGTRGDPTKVGLVLMFLGGASLGEPSGDRGHAVCIRIKIL